MAQTMRPHGTESRYVYDRCRCKKCRRARAKTAQKYRASKGADSLVSPKRALTHMRNLGVPTQLIGKIGGIESSVISRLPKRKRIHKSTERQILNVTSTKVNEYLAVTRQGFVPAAPTLELLEDLKVTGLSIYRIERETGVRLRVRHLQMQARKARRIESVYRKIGARDSIAA